MARFTSYMRLSHESTTQDWERQSHCSSPRRIRYRLYPAGRWRKPLDALDRCACGDWYPCSDYRARIAAVRFDWAGWLDPVTGRIVRIPCHAYVVACGYGVVRFAQDDRGVLKAPVPRFRRPDSCGSSCRA